MLFPGLPLAKEYLLFFNIHQRKSQKRMLMQQQLAAEGGTSFNLTLQMLTNHTLQREHSKK
jgi:hypothetical protein